MKRDSSPSLFETETYERLWPTTAAHRWQVAFQEFLLAHEQTAQFARFFGGAEALALSAKDLHDVHHRAIGYLHNTLNGGSRRNFIQAIDAFAQTWGVPAETGGPAADAMADRLDEEGFAVLSPLDTTVADAARAALEMCVLTSWSGDFAGTSEDLRGRSNLGIVGQQDVLQTPSVWRLGFDPAVLAIARRHLGAPPLLLDIAAWKSFAAPERARDAQLFHYDLDDYRFCKLFIYLTDVGPEDGPHVFVPGTHRPETVAAARPAEGDPERPAFDAWYFKSLRKSDADTLRWFGREPVRLTGARGGRFLVNTEGLHKGEPPAGTDRWMLQFLYGVSAFTQWGGDFEVPVLPAGDASRDYAAQLLFGGPNRFRVV